MRITECPESLDAMFSSREPWVKMGTPSLKKMGQELVRALGQLGPDDRKAAPLVADALKASCYLPASSACGVYQTLAELNLLKSPLDEGAPESNAVKARLRVLATLGYLLDVFSKENREYLKEALVDWRS